MTIEKDNGLRGQEAQVVRQIDGDEEAADLTLLVSTDAMDDEGDVVEQSWSFPSQIPFLFVHDNKSLPVGHIMNPRVVGVDQLPPSVRRDLSDDATEATIVDVNADTDDPFAEAVLRKYRRGDIEDSSVGFDPQEFERFGEDEAGRLHFLSSTLKEVSATPIGANSDTTVLRKSFDAEVIPEQLMDDDAEDADEPTGKGDAPDQTKEGRRNSKMDEKVQEHIKECAEYLKGDREEGEVKMCPLHKMDDDKSGEVEGEKDDGPTTDLHIDADDIGEIVEQKVREVLEGAGDAPDEQKDHQGHDDADEPEGDGLQIQDGTIIKFSQETSGQSGSSSGDGTAETPETVDELFAQ